MSLAFQFLGPPQLVLENETVNVNRRSIVALLAYLAVNDSGQTNQTYTRESLSALLWPDYDQVKAFTNLRHTLWEIQKTFGPGWLIANRENIGLQADANLWVDVHRFESLLSQSQTLQDIPLRIPLLTESVKLYRHHFLTGFNLRNSPTFDQWSVAKSDELRHKFMEALTLLTEDHCLLGEGGAAVPYARRLVTMDPLNESAHRLLMQVYSQIGQPNAALKQYQDFEQILRKELGLDPQPETRALYRQIRKGDIKYFQAGIKREIITSPNNLPQQLTSFIGREKEQEEIVRLLAINRLVMLTGSGGVGKTRLSLQVGAKVLNQFPDGVWLVELAPLANPDLIPQTILSSLHLGEQAGKTALQVLEEQLNNKKLLLILDNCEHLVEASAKVAHALLMSTPEVTILATSREVLGIREEFAWRVPSLAHPDPKSSLELEQLTQYESVHLFLERALWVQPHFKADEASMPAIAQICSRLDGIPLAIELAAARVKALSVNQIARRLDDRFRLLTRGSYTVLERHQTLRAAIDWSYNLLNDDEKNLLARLSIFMGGWTLEAAEQVCVRQEDEFEVLDVLSDLIDKSLVIVDGSADEARYHLLETTRQYAREKLFKLEQVERWQDKHLAHFLALAEKGNSEIRGAHQAEVINQLDAELDNFRAALDWCVSNHLTESALQMLGALGWAWDMRGYYNEMRGWFDKIRVLGECANYPEFYARLLNHLGRFAATFDGRPEAESILEESHAIWLQLGSHGERGLSDVLCFLGMNASFHEGNIDKAEPFFRQSLALSQQCDNKSITAANLRFLGDIEYERGNLTTTLELYEQSLALSQQIGDLLIISIASGQLGGLFVELGSYEKARPLIEQQLNVNEKLQFQLGLADAWIGMGDLHRHQGDYVQAEDCFEKSISVSRILGLQGHICSNLYLLALLPLHQNDYSSAMFRFMEYFEFARAIEAKISLCRFLTGMSAVAGGTNQSIHCAKLFGASQTILGTIKFRLSQFDRIEFDRHIQMARDQLGKAEFDMLCNEGCTMTLEQAVAFALSVRE
jgi:predicted ATPase/DNA-binding SARP family transcriptional activator